MTTLKNLLESNTDFRMITIVKIVENPKVPKVIPINNESRFFILLVSLTILSVHLLISF